MISYSTNWMGPISTKWYEERNIPFVMKNIPSHFSPLHYKLEYKDYLESYSCGRIDIYGLDEEEYWCGKHEYSVAPMRSEDWNRFSAWLYEMQTEELWSYEKLIEHFQYYNKADIRWDVK